MHCIVGLGNPGKQYAKTRHNAGAWFVEFIAKHYHLTLKPSKKYYGLYHLANLHETACHLLIPETFMNDSGKAVAALFRYHPLTPDALLVAHDDIDLPVGAIKLKFD